MLGCSLAVNKKSLIERSGFFFMTCRRFCGRGSLFFFNRPAFRKAWSRMYWIWPLVLRNSSAAQASIASIISASTRRMKLLTVLSFFGHILVLILNSYINDVGSRYLRQVALPRQHKGQPTDYWPLRPFRSSSSSTILSLSSLFKASWTMLTAPSTIRSLAAIIASACWRRNMLRRSRKHTLSNWYELPIPQCLLLPNDCLIPPPVFDDLPVIGS